MANPHPVTTGLTPFKPGVSGNPQGRPRKRPQTEANEDLLRRPAPKDVVRALRSLGLREDATCADVMAICLFRQGMKGDVAAIKELRESVEGKSTQRFEFTPGESGIAQFNVVYAAGVPSLPEKSDESKVIDMVPTTEKKAENE